MPLDIGRLALFCVPRYKLVYGTIASKSIDTSRQAGECPKNLGYGVDLQNEGTSSRVLSQKRAHIDVSIQHLHIYSAYRLVLGFLAKHP
jgi:hypothetical protein